MNALNELKTYAGNWQGTTRLYLSETEPPDESASTLTVTIAENEAVQIACTWAYDGTPQNGTLLLHEETPGQIVALWTDTFHTEGKPMKFRSSDGTFSLLGAYAAPPGPDWGWRIVFESGSDGSIFPLRMFNITPEGVEEIAVKADYHRVV